MPMLRDNPRFDYPGNIARSPGRLAILVAATTLALLALFWLLGAGALGAEQPQQCKRYQVILRGWSLQVIKCLDEPPDPAVRHPPSRRPGWRRNAPG